MNRTIKFRVWNGKIMQQITPRDFGWLGENVLDDESYKVMQFTGLLDKNGKEIYEGDIVRYYDSTTMWLTAEVKWLNSSWSIQSDGMDGDDIQLDNFSAKEPELRGIEVIGNIYENPELLI